MNGGWRRRWRDGRWCGWLCEGNLRKFFYASLHTNDSRREMGPKRVWPDKVSSKVKGRGVGGYRRQSCSHIVIVVICSVCVCVSVCCPAELLKVKQLESNSQSALLCRAFALSLPLTLSLSLSFSLSLISCCLYSVSCCPSFSFDIL